MTKKVAHIGAFALLGTAAVYGCEGDGVAPGQPGLDASLGLDSSQSDFDATGRDAEVDADVDAGPPCDPGAPFGAKRLLGEVSQPGPSREADARLSADGKTLFFSRNGVISMSARKADGTFEVGAAIPNIGAGGFPSVSSDGARLYFEQGGQIAVSRAQTDGGWSTPAVLAISNPPPLLAQPYVRPDREVLYFSGPAPGRDIWKAERGGADEFRVVAVIPELAADASTSGGDDAWEFTPLVTPNGLAMYFASDRGMARGAMRVWMAHRQRVSDSFGAPVLVPSAAGGAVESVFPDWISADECTLLVHDDDIHVMERGR